MKSRKSDYLKYWRVVKYYIKARYDITQTDLEMLLFLYSEDYFDRDKFEEYDRLISWDLKRFERLRHEGWIEVFRKNQGNRRAIYELSMKAKRVCDLVYKKLEGEEISTDVQTNPMYKRNVGYNDKVYRTAIEQMNAYSKEQLAKNRQLKKERGEEL